MKVVSLKVDDETKRRMEELRDINWSEVLRRAIQRRLQIEEELRKPIDRRRAIRAAEAIDKFRQKLLVGWKGAEEIRKWRELRRR